jgi:hypothetical protein
MMAGRLEESADLRAFRRRLRDDGLTAWPEARRWKRRFFALLAAAGAVVAWLLFLLGQR